MENSIVNAPLHLCDGMGNQVIGGAFTGGIGKSLAMMAVLLLLVGTGL